MATNFPTSLDNLSNPAGSDPVNNPSHAAQHANVNDAIEALENKVGANGSTVTTSHDYKITQLEAAISAGASGARSIYQDVRNQSGSAIAKATPVYVSGSIGASGKLLISVSSNAAESTSSKTMGLTTSTISNNNNGQVITEGIIENVDTTGGADGDPIWLGTNGTKIYGLANKPYAPAHLVFLGVVVRGGNAQTGSIYVKIQNGFEIEELHNVQIISPATGDVIVYNATTGQWSNSNTIASKTYVDNAITSLGNTASNTYVPQSDVGNIDGVASLDGTGKVPDSQIPAGIARDSEVSSSISTAINNLINSAPGTLDTLGEIATQLAADESAAAALTTVVNGKVSKAGGDIITSSLPSVVGLTIKGAASQTADLQQWQLPDATTVASITATTTGGSTNGVLKLLGAYGGIVSNGEWKIQRDGGQLSVLSPNGTIFQTVYSGTTLSVRGNSGQTANLQEWQNNSGTVLSSITPSGDLNFGSNLWNIKTNGTNVIQWQPTQGSMFLSYGSSNPPITIQGSSGQTANLTNWQNSSGSILAYIRNDGLLNTPAVLSNYTWIGGFQSGVSVGITPAVLNEKALVVKSLASQTADLTQWINSTGTVLAKVDASGAMFTITPADSTNTTQVATTAYVKNNINNLINSAPGALDTLNELAAALGNDASFSTTITNSLALKAPLASPTFTGTPLAPTATSGTNTTQIATTAFVKTAIDSSVQPGALYQTSAPSSPAIGQIWIDSDDDVTVFDSNIIRRKSFTATAGQTVFVTDIPFIDGFEQVFMNGLLLVKTTDYTVSGGNTVTLTSGAAVSDIIEVVSVTGANSVNTYTQAETNALLAANTSVAPLSISANTTLVAKKRYFVTSASALTLTLPASPALNDEIQIVDASGNSSTYNITVARNANKINGGDNNLIIDTNGGWYTLLYTGATYGWKVG
jgi:hypothetical protein